jgi:addiction module HigA family antidote
MHPGAFFSEAYLKPGKISVTTAANSMGINKSTLSRLIAGKQDLTCEMAVRLSKFVGNSVEQWMNLQLNFSIDKAYDSVGAEHITVADIEIEVAKAWEKQLEGKSVYLSSEEAEARIQKKILELKEKAAK